VRALNTALNPVAITPRIGDYAELAAGDQGQLLFALHAVRLCTVGLDITCAALFTVAANFQASLSFLGSTSTSHSKVWPVMVRYTCR
jgi:hypothetical protein